MARHCTNLTAPDRASRNAVPCIAQLVRWARLMVVVVTGLLATLCPAHAAATVRCIEASRYTALVRITDGDFGRIARGLGRAPNQRPPENGCRAVLLSGNIEAGSARSLLQAIDENRGWLATVYLSISNGDLTEEIELAELLRGFDLEVRLLQADALYEPDFIAPFPSLPASVSNGWTNARRTVDSPLALALQDYTRSYPRVISSGGLRCGTGCWTLLAGGVDRLLVNFPAHDARAPLDPDTDTADTERIRAAVRAHYGFNAALRKLPAGYATEPAFSRTAPQAAQEIHVTCQGRIDYANALQTEIGKTLDDLATRDFPLIPLEQIAVKVRAIQEASDAVQRCATAAMERDRFNAYSSRCKAGCDIDALLGSLTQSAKGIIAQSR